MDDGDAAHDGSIIEGLRDAIQHARGDGFPLEESVVYVKNTVEDVFDLLDAKREAERNLKTALYEAKHARETAMRMRLERDTALKERDAVVALLCGIFAPVLENMGNEARTPEGQSVMNAIRAMQAGGVR